jgi:hypothetical protein
MGLSVERREVVGSPFPQRIAPWIGWLGYGLLVTAAFALTLLTNILSWILALLICWLGLQWVVSVLGNQIHLGRARLPLKRAPLVIAKVPMGASAPVKVVFQAILGGLRPDFFHLVPLPRFGTMLCMVFAFLVVTAFTMASRLGSLIHPESTPVLMIHRVLTQWVYPGVLALNWIVILCILSWDYHQSRWIDGLKETERRGLAVLLEMARTWPRKDARSIEPVFVAAGGQRLDYAGSRAVVGLLESEWMSKPSLLILLFAPGAGPELRLCINAPRGSEPRKLAESAARSLWIPISGTTDPWALLPLWPFDRCTPAIALIGSDPKAFFDASTDPQALHRAAQLATEIALRWARPHRQPGSGVDSPT